MHPDIITLFNIIGDVIIFGGVVCTIVGIIIAVQRKPKGNNYMSKAWTEDNDGVNLPDHLDASEHSGDFEATQEIIEDNPMHTCPHNGKWTGGVLPGGRKIVHCELCGMWKDAIEHKFGESNG